MIHSHRLFYGHISQRLPIPLEDAMSVTESVTTQAQHKNWKFVTHNRPDTDALACMWGAVSFIVKDGDDYVLTTTRAGERLPPEEEEGFDVLYMDTGGGDLDQHGMELARASSFQLLAQKYGFDKEPGIIPILELTLAADNIEEMPWTSAHYVLKGLQHHFWKKDEGTDWARVFDTASIILDVLYGQALGRYEAKKAFDKALHEDNVQITNLPNGLKVIDVGFRPRLRGEAFERGADVVVWMAPKGPGVFYPGIQVHRHSDIKLGKVVSEIRRAEAEKRKVSSRGMDLFSFSPIPELGGWFYHDSGKLVACGTQTHELTEEERTTLSRGKIVSVVKTALTSIAPNMALVNKK